MVLDLIVGVSQIDSGDFLRKETWTGTICQINLESIITSSSNQQSLYATSTWCLYRWDHSDGLEGCVIGQGLFELCEKRFEIDIYDLPDDKISISFNVSKLNHEDSLPHFAYVETIDFASGIVGELSVVNIDISELAHAEVLPTEVLELDQRLLWLIISTDLVDEDSSFAALAIGICLCIN